MEDFVCSTCNIDNDNNNVINDFNISNDDIMTVYSTGCPKCKIIENKLNYNHIRYNIVSDIDVIKSKGYFSVPMVEYKGKVYNFSEANNLINNWGKNN